MKTKKWRNTVRQTERIIMKELYEQLGISSQVYDFCHEIEESLKERFEKFDKTAEYNQMKVLLAMQKNRVSEECFGSSSGYGYNDYGRDTLEKVYADTFHTEACLVRPQIACGTHALAIALFGNLRPGDEMLAPAGKPYDTLEEVIGIRPSKGSLAEYGVTYRQVDLLEDGTFDYENIRKAINEKTKLVEIQRSKGYMTRPSFSVKQIGELIAFVKSIKPDVICMVDNCYGEFVDTIEPSDVGADMVVGSLIKNPGGGLAPIGGYIAGTKECVENASYRMTCPGLGAEVGASLGVNRSFYQGFFLAPMVTKGALKGAVFAANIYEKLGFEIAFRTVNEAADEKVAFLKLGTLVIETYENKAAELRSGAIDHVAIDVKDIEKVHEMITGAGLNTTQDEVHFLPFWENGVRFFTIEGPNKEKVEFSQYL